MPGALAYYEQRIGLLTKGLRDEMLTYLTRLGACGSGGWWWEAIDEARARERPNWRYIRGILDRCLADGRPPSGAGSPSPGGKRGNGNGHAVFGIAASGDAHTDGVRAATPAELAEWEAADPGRAG